MLDSLLLSYSGNLDRTSGRADVFSHIWGLETQRMLYKRTPYCYARVSKRTCLHKSPQPKHHTFGIIVHSLRKQSQIGSPQCLAEFNSDFSKRSAGRSSRDAMDGSSTSSLRLTSADGTSVESHKIDVVTNSSRPQDPLVAWNHPFNHANTVGILGGLSPVATVDFMRKIVDATDAEDGGDPIPLVLCSDPYMRKIISPNPPVTAATASSSATSLAGGGLGGTELEQTLQAFVENRRFLERAGARCIVMPCHVSHLWYDQLSEGCSVPFLHMADCVIEELKAADLKPLEGGDKPKIGVLGTEPTFGATFYPEKLSSQGFDVLLPDLATMEHAVVPGLAALHRGDLEGARNLLRIAVQVLLVNAANVVLLACHYTPTVFPADDFVLRKCIDPTDALVRATVKWSQSVKQIRAVE